MISWSDGKLCSAGLTECSCVACRIPVRPTYLNPVGDHHSDGLTVQLCSSGLTVQLCSSGLTVELCSAGLTVQVCSAGLTVQLYSAGLTVQLCSAGQTVQLCSFGQKVQLCLTVQLCSTAVFSWSDATGVEVILRYSCVQLF